MFGRARREGRGDGFKSADASERAREGEEGRESQTYVTSSALRPLEEEIERGRWER